MEMGGILEKLCSVLLGSLTLFPGVGGGILVGVNRPVLHSLRSRHLEVVGERENGRAQGRHARGPSPLASTSFPGFSPTHPTGRREVMHQFVS